MGGYSKMGFSEFEQDLFSNIVSLLRELDTSLLSVIVEQMDEDKQEQGLLS